MSSWLDAQGNMAHLSASRINRMNGFRRFWVFPAAAIVGANPCARLADRRVCPWVKPRRFRNTRPSKPPRFFVLVDVQVLLVKNTNEGGLFLLHHGLSGLSDFADFWVSHPEGERSGRLD